MILRGHDAIEAKEENDAVILNKSNDPIEGAKENITLDEAREIAKADPSLIFASVELLPGHPLYRK